MIKTKSQAVQFTHTLSNTSKMPCKSYSLPTSICKVGAKLRDIPGSTCHGCYADKGCYNWSSTQNAMQKRYELTRGEQWVQGMIKQLENHKLFRWHDSGDIYSTEYLDKIIDVVKSTPDTRHWLPTREKALIKAYIRKHGSLPENLTVRLSAAMVDGKPAQIDGINTSTVHTGDAIGHECPAYSQNGECGDCRACWNKTIDNVSYPLH